MSRPTVGDLIALGSGGYSLMSNVEDFKVAGNGDKFVELTWQDPTDVVLDGTTITSWAGTQIRRKTGNYPVNEKDGILVVDSKVRDQYKTTPYEDSGLTNDVEYYYMAFPYTDRNVFTVDAANRVNATPSEYTPDPTTWAGIQEIIRRGLTIDFFAIGDQITSTFDGKAMKWDIIGINHDIPTDKNYTNSMTLQAHDILEQRQWHSSNVNRYINSTGRAYLNNTTSSGFIGKIDPALAAVIGAVDKQVTKTTSEGGQDLFSDKVFSLSPVEVNFASEGVTTGESVYAFYQGAVNADRIKTYNGSAGWWWLRSPTVSGTSTARSVVSDGSLTNNTASGSRGFAPALVIV